MKANTNKVIVFENNSFENAIINFIDEIRENSDNTANSYDRYIKEYFFFVLKKELSEITWEDIYNIKYSNTQQYKEYLSNMRKNSPKTINVKLCAVRSLFEHLENHIDHKIDSRVVKVKLFKNADNKKKSYGSLSVDELEKLYEYCLGEKCKPLIKKLYFETAIVSGLRSKAILSITWNDIRKWKDESGQEVWAICVRDKGNEYDATPITDEFYNKLRQLYEGIDSQEVFSIDSQTLATVLNNFCKVNGISEERNICLHSLKKTGMDIIYYNTHDIEKAAQHGHHKGIEMAYRNYLGKNAKLKEKSSYSFFGKQGNFDEIKNLSHEELLNAIEKCGQYMWNEILQRAVN